MITKPTAAATIVARAIPSGHPKRWPTRSSIWISANAAARYASDHCTILRCRSLSKTSSTRPPPVRRECIAAPAARAPRWIQARGRHYGRLPPIAGAPIADGNAMTLLADLVDTSEDRRRDARRGSRKCARSPSGCARSTPDEIEIGAQYLSGAAPQGRLGIGYATLHGAGDGAPAARPTLTIADVDRALGEIAVTARRRRGREPRAQRCARCSRARPRPSASS